MPGSAEDAGPWACPACSSVNAAHVDRLLPCVRPPRGRGARAAARRRPTRTIFHRPAPGNRFDPSRYRGPGAPAPAADASAVPPAARTPRLAAPRGRSGRIPVGDPDAARPRLAGRVINVATAAAYAYDKLAAPRGARRVRERTLWILCLAGGVGGAWLVFFAMRHKTQHRSFWIVQSIATVIWVAILLWLCSGSSAPRPPRRAGSLTACRSPGSGHASRRRSRVPPSPTASASPTAGRPARPSRSARSTRASSGSATRRPGCAAAWWRPSGTSSRPGSRSRPTPSRRRTGARASGPSSGARSSRSTGAAYPVRYFDLQALPARPAAPASRPSCAESRPGGGHPRRVAEDPRRHRRRARSDRRA